MKTTRSWHKWQSAAILKRYLLHVTVAYRERERERERGREGEIWTVDDCLISSSHVVVAVHSQGVFIFNHPHRGRKRQLDPEKKPNERTNWKIAGWDRGWKNIHEKNVSLTQFDGQIKGQSTRWSLTRDENRARVSKREGPSKTTEEREAFVPSVAGTEHPHQKRST